MKYRDTGSSGVAKAGMATGITALGLTLLGGNGGLLRNVFGAPAPAAFAQPAGTVVSVDASGTPVVYNNGYVTEKELCLVREINGKDSKIDKLESEKYTVEHVSASLAPVYAKINEQEREICGLKAALGMETERRECGDEKLLEYVRGNYIKAEKSLNSSHINYHGVKPALKLDNCDC